MSEFNGGICVGIIIGLAILAAVLCLLFAGEKEDLVNTRALGEILCNEQGLEYSHRKMMGTDSIGNIPKIYCTNPNSKKNLLDGIVVLE